MALPRLRHSRPAPGASGCHGSILNTVKRIGELCSLKIPIRRYERNSWTEDEGLKFAEAEPGEWRFCLLRGRKPEVRRYGMCVGAH